MNGKSNEGLTQFTDSITLSLEDLVKHLKPSISKAVLEDVFQRLADFPYISSFEIFENALPRLVSDSIVDVFSRTQTGSASKYSACEGVSEHCQNTAACNPGSGVCVTISENQNIDSPRNGVYELYLNPDTSMRNTSEVQKLSGAWESDAVSKTDLTGSLQQPARHGN
ncbi:hypothetical protein CEUSTIGMA_g814.t1 [Chlamydomonas eustigma]|uniref:Uncharacterized protein n=1 Tax=Chlamydomonas eustigma TaxID=1157962 RepID=A0A250WRD8_9CHLO|nr:hypothetical protein CEUSTIGMA_g814.t1 [Chlamydomonas eustigma]|eukprot:GAX73361.1 hypothetical protein CEUSTIGMA_g814.t1 [Chlamydomonas eustigma]